MAVEIKDELARNRDIQWYLVCCTNSGMLHTYSTVIGSEKSNWVPFSGYDEEEIKGNIPQLSKINWGGTWYWVLGTGLKE